MDTTMDAQQDCNRSKPPWVGKVKVVPLVHVPRKSNKGTHRSNVVTVLPLDPSDRVSNCLCDDRHLHGSWMLVCNSDGSKFIDCSTLDLGQRVKGKYLVLFSVPHVLAVKQDSVWNGWHLEKLFEGVRDGGRQPEPERLKRISRADQSKICTRGWPCRSLTRNGTGP